LIYLLDSNSWIAVFRGKNLSILAHLKHHAASDIVLCSVVLAELWYGVLRSSPSHRANNEALVLGVRNNYVSIPFDDVAAMDCAAVRAALDTRGLPIGPHDLMIAGIARSRGLTVVTHNTAEFSRVGGLLLEDWQIP
jgi:tRNA(fMet)-specific endonuclease VapC